MEITQISVDGDGWCEKLVCTVMKHKKMERMVIMTDNPFRDCRLCVMKHTQTNEFRSVEDWG